MSELLPLPPVPEALSKRGIRGVTDNVGADQTFRLSGSLIFSFYRDELMRRFLKPLPPEGAALGDQAGGSK